MSWTNYHSHSHYCDGKEAPEVHIQAAIEKGFWAFGCSSHAHVPFEAHWCMKEENKGLYVKEIRALQRKYADQIEVYLSLEIDYIPGIIGPGTVREEMQLDYTVGSVHFVEFMPDGRPWGIDGTLKEFEEGLTKIFNRDVEKAVSRYYALTRKMLTEDCPDILGHMDKVKMHNQQEKYFSEEAPWYRKEVLQTLEVAKESGVIVELNTRGLYKKKSLNPYPSPWILEQMYQMGIPITLNSDSHHPSDIDKYYRECAEILHEIGFRELRILKKGRWENRAFSSQGLLG